MKQIVNKKYFLGLFLLSIFLMVGIVSVTNGQTFISTDSGNSEHIVRLHSLFLWGNSVDDNVSMRVNTGNNYLSITGGLAIGKNHSATNNASFSVIGGGKSGHISGLGNGIVGGEGNTLEGKYSLIGGGKSNVVKAENSVIGGGSGNEVKGNNSVIAGGGENLINGENSIILGGQHNKINGKNSLIFGQYAEGETGSFVFGIGKSEHPIIGKENSARIDTASGVLIGTYTPITGVRLVINGALSLTGTYDMEGGTGGEIRVVNGCIYAYDGSNWQVVGKSSRESSNCGGEIKACQFGETILYQGDTVDAYKNFWSSSNCNSIRVTCSGGNLVDTSDNTGTYYPYCYEI